MELSKKSFDILQTFISPENLSVRTFFSKYSFPKKLQYIFRATGYGLRKSKILSVSHGNLSVLKRQIYTCYFKHKIYCNI